MDVRPLSTGSLQLGDLVDRVANIASQQDAKGIESAREAIERGEQAEAAKQLEALFATLLVKEMRRALPKGFFGQGAGADIYEGWLDEHVGSVLAQDGALSLAGMIKANLGNDSDETVEAPEKAIGSLNRDAERAELGRLDKGRDR